MRVRILHVSDTHLGTRRYVRGGPPGWSRAHDHHAAFRRAVSPALRGDVDLVVHTGDVFDRSRPPARWVAAGAALLEEVARRVPLVLISGNHDRRGIRRHLPLTVPGLHVVDSPTRLRIRDVVLALVPYRRTAEAWAAAAHRAVGPGADLLLCHQSFHGSRVPGLVFRVGHHRETVGEAHLPPGIRHVLCGHIHPRQALRVGPAEVVHPGSSERTAFSERGEPKGYAIWGLARTVSWRFVDLPARPMRVVTTPAEAAAVQPGDLVRLAADLPESDLLARGAFLVGPPRTALSTPRRPQSATTPQLPLFASP